MRALDPHRVGPLQEPGARVHIAGERDPWVVDAELISLVPYVLEQNDPLFPQVGGMIETVWSTIHMMVILIVANNALALRECVVLCVIGIAIPLPVVDAVIGHPLECELLELVDIALVCNVNRAASGRSVARLGNDVRKLAIEVIAAARANPNAEVRAELLHKRRRRRELIGELGVECPETFGILARAGAARVNRSLGVVVVVPTVVNDIGVERTNTRGGEVLVHRLEGIENVVLVDEHHVVKPGVVLNTELTWPRNALDIAVEIGSDHIVVRTVGMGSAHDSLPRDVLAIRSELAIALKIGEILTGPVAHTAQAIDNLRIGLGELRAHEHAVDVDRLAQVGTGLGHLNNAALAFRDGPGVVRILNVEMLTVDIVETDVLILGFNLEELAHEVVAVIHDDLLGHRGETVTKLHRLEGERQHLAGFLDIIDRRGSIANLCLSIKLKTARLELRLTRTALERIELLLIQVEFGTRGEAAALRLEHANAHITTGLSLIEPKIGHLAGAIIIIGRAQIDRERALLVSVLEQGIFAVRDIHGELLKGTVSTLDVATRVTDRLEGALRSLAAIDRQIDRKLLRVAFARAIAGMIVGGEVTVDQSIISAAFVGGNGRSRHGPALGLVHNGIARSAEHVELRCVHIFILVGRLPMIGRKTSQANRLCLHGIKGDDGGARILHGAILHECHPRAVGFLVLELVRLDSTRAVIARRIVVARRIANACDGFDSTKIYNKVCRARSLCRRSPVGTCISIDRL